MTGGATTGSVDTRDPSRTLTLKFNADPRAARRAQLAARDWLAQHELDRDTSDHAIIVLAEVLNNIVEHAYQDSQAGGIDMRLAVDAHEIHFRITDSGIAMPGGKPPPHLSPDVDVPGSALPESGFGWSLIHALCRRVDYRRLNATNVLSLSIAHAATRQAPH